MKRRNEQQKVARAARRKVRRQRRRGGVASIMLGPNDGAVVFRASGRLQFHDSRAEPNPGTGAFWIHMLRWLFVDSEDGEERRQILVDDFMLNLQEHATAVRKAAIEEQAKERAIAEIAGMDGEPEMTDERVEELVKELLPKYVAEVEAEIDGQAQEAEDEELDHEAAKSEDGDDLVMPEEAGLGGTDPASMISGSTPEASEGCQFDGDEEKD